MSNLTVLIITRNRLEKLKRCIDSVLKNLINTDIIVVDNESNDGTKNYLENNKNIIKTIFLKENIGVAGARNIGIKNCITDFIMFLDDDAWVEKLDFEMIQKYFDINPKVGLIAPKILYPNGKLQESIRTFPNIKALIWRGTKLYKLFPNVYWYKNYVKHDEKKIHEIDWSIGACQIVRYSIFDRIGLLDKKYFFGYEDTDFCLRLRQSDLLSIYWPEAIIYHEYTRTSAKILNISLLRHIYSIVRFFLKKNKIILRNYSDLSTLRYFV
jgi:GT2 family glycosyltransferase